MQFSKFSSEFDKFVKGVPMPSSISYMWNFGSLLGFCLIIQLLTGIFLSFHYSSSVGEAYNSVVHIMEEVKGGWIVRLVHANCASFFFLFIFMHVARGLYYKSFILTKVWSVGVVLLFMLMGEAFLGYVLPWGQMSFWGATVITNLLSAFPKGEEVVVWIWGGYSVSEPTLSRFFSIHYLIPFMMVGISVSHIIFLHEKGSSNPLGVSSQSYKIYFHPYFSVKDLVGLCLFVFTLFIFVFVTPYSLMDPDNFVNANPMVTPQHIQPEWYFLFAYAILRSIPSKLGGVIALVLSILWLFLLPMTHSSVMGVNFDIKWKQIFFSYCVLFLLLTWIGSMPPEGKMLSLGKIVSFSYFVVVAMIMS